MKYFEVLLPTRRVPNLTHLEVSLFLNRHAGYIYLQVILADRIINLNLVDCNEVSTTRRVKLFVVELRIPVYCSTEGNSYSKRPTSVYKGDKNTRLAQISKIIKLHTQSIEISDVHEHEYIL